MPRDAASPSMGEYTLWTATQIPHIVKVDALRHAASPRRSSAIIAPDVGGGFGSKLNVYAEEALALALAKRLGRPIKWIEERARELPGDDPRSRRDPRLQLAGTEDGKILGMKFVEIADMGAYFQLLTPGIPELGGWVYMGPYDPQAYWYEFTGVLTNATPDRRLPRRRAARGHVRGRARSWTRSRGGSARTRPRSAG